MPMTPQERQLVADLFGRLASLEGERRDPEAEKAIRDGLAGAPNAVYALVQTVLVQDEALKRANDRLQELEGTAPQEGFLDSVRNAVFGREQRQGSVPAVRPGGAGVWGDRYAQSQSQAPMGAPPAAPGGYGAGAQAGPFGGGYGGTSGGSFLGTAAAAAAGVIGGALLLNGIRGMFGPQHGGQSAFDPGLSGGGSPWGSGGSGGDLAREAGLDDIGSSRSAAYDSSGPASLLGGADDDDSDGDYDGGGDFGGDGDTA
jgi:hypothetical protein